MSFLIRKLKPPWVSSRQFRSCCFPLPLIRALPHTYLSYPSGNGLCILSSHEPQNACKKLPCCLLIPILYRPNCPRGSENQGITQQNAMPPRGGGSEARTGIPDLLGQTKKALERVQGAPQLHVLVKMTLGLSENLVFNSEKLDFIES